MRVLIIVMLVLRKPLLIFYLKNSQSWFWPASFALLLFHETWSAPANMSVPMIKDIYTPGHRVAHPELCPALGYELNLIILVFSAPRHFMERQAVRLTWGLQAKTNKVPVAFIVGSSAPDVQQSVLKEDKMYKDIIMTNCVDSYTNLTLKTISALEWVDTYCYKVKKILKADDDTFTNIPLLISFVKDRVNVTRTIWGNQIAFNPDSSPTVRFYLPKAQYREKLHQRFLSGSAYLMSRDIVSAFLTKALAQNQTYFILEDVFFTGVLADDLKISRVHAKEFNNSKVDWHSDPCIATEYISIHGMRFEDQSYCQNLLSDCRKNKKNSFSSVQSENN